MRWVPASAKILPDSRLSRISLFSLDSFVPQIKRASSEIETAQPVTFIGNGIERIASKGFSGSLGVSAEEIRGARLRSVCVVFLLSCPQTIEAVTINKPKIQDFIRHVPQWKKGEACIQLVRLIL